MCIINPFLEGCSCVVVIFCCICFENPNKKNKKMIYAPCLLSFSYVIYYSRSRNSSLDLIIFLPANHFGNWLERGKVFDVLEFSSKSLQKLLNSELIHSIYQYTILYVSTYVHVYTYSYIQIFTVWGCIYKYIYIFTNINMYTQTRIDMTGELQVCFVVAFFFLSSFYLFLYIFLLQSQDA